MLHKPLLIEGIITQRINDHTAVQQIEDHVAGAAVAFLLPVVRFVGDVVKHLRIRISHPGELPAQGGEERFQKFTVLGAVGADVPAEFAHIAGTVPHNDFRRVQRAPLREQVRDFQHPDPIFAAQAAPAAKLFPSEKVFPVLEKYVHQLYRRALPADGGVQRRREYGRQQDVDAKLLRGQRDLLFYRVPMLLAEYRNMIIIRQTVGMEPFRVQKRLIRQPARQDPQRQL